MKKFIATSVLAITAAYVHGQGTIAVYSLSPLYATYTSTSLYSSAGTASGGTLAKTPLTSIFDYVLLAEPLNASLTGTTPTLLQLSTLSVAQTGITNFDAAGGIAGPGHNVGAATLLTTSWTAPQASYTDGTGVEDSYVLVGWSSSLGSSWSTVYSELAAGNPGGLTGYFGTTEFGAGYTGGGADVLPAPSIFGVSSAEPGGLTAGPTLYTVSSVPEPTTVALGVMGVASLLALRRKQA